MIGFLIFILFVAVGTLGYLLYALHQRVEKISQNQAIMVGWCETLRENQETLMSDMKKIRNEIQSLEKETRSK
jgi:hypothetical protein